MRRILVVTADHHTKVKRIKNRSNLAANDIERIMQTQLDDTQRLSFADDVIINDGTIDAAYRQVAKLHDQYINLATS